MLDIMIGILIPLAGTTLGAGCVFFTKKVEKPKEYALFLGIASGVMMAASVWSLLLPSIEMAQSMGKFSFVPATVGMMLGMLFLFWMGRVIPWLQRCDRTAKNAGNKLAHTTMLTLAVTLHNLPEGMAVGVAFAGILTQEPSVSLAGAYALAVGIAIQNLPEGAIISLPLRSKGYSRTRAFLSGALSGVVEPIGAILTILLARYLIPLVPYLLAFAAGAMIDVVIEELIPETARGAWARVGTIGFLIGFLLMMSLDVALG